MRKPDFCLGENKGADQLRSFVLDTQIVQSFIFLNPKFQASSLLRRLYRVVCVRLGGKPQRPDFSRHGSYYTALVCSDIYHQGSIREIPAMKIYWSSQLLLE